MEVHTSREVLTKTSVQYLSKRRNTERIPEELNPFRCRLNNHGNNQLLLPETHQKNNDCSCSRRRHTLSPNVSREFFEKETKLIVLEFLQVSTPRFKLDKKPTQNKSLITSIKENDIKEDFVVEKSKGDATINMTKRPVKRERKVSKAKTVTIGEKDRKEINAELENKERNGKRFKRSSSDLTLQQYQLMKRTFQQMQLPLIQWLKEHESPVVEDDGDNEDNENDGDNKTKDGNILVFEEEIVPVKSIEVESLPIHEILLSQSQPSENETNNRYIIL